MEKANGIRRTTGSFLQKLNESLDGGRVADTRKCKRFLSKTEFDRIHRSGKACFNNYIGDVREKNTGIGVFLASGGIKAKPIAIDCKRPIVGNFLHEKAGAETDEISLNRNGPAHHRAQGVAHFGKKVPGSGRA
jgi:hypothetical protein